MANALIDNSERFLLVKYIKGLVSRPECNHIMIATGYWDLPCTALVYEELKDFFARGGKLDLLIGQEPQLQYYQEFREAHQFPDFYIQRDVESLTDVYKPYTWEYKKSCGPYSVYGYEPYNIKIKAETKEKLSKPNTSVRGHDVPEDALKRYIQLTVIYMMNKKLQAFILPTLEYLSYTQDSQKHQIIY